MTTTSIDAVGFCAQYSIQGDWAFEFALKQARERKKRLNIFYFLGSPDAAEELRPRTASRADRERLMIQSERTLRFYYDGRLGDYLEVGFRVCDDGEWTELHRCLCRRQFQLLVLALPAYDATLAGRPLVTFARKFICPVVLVGPNRPEEFYLNEPAALLHESLGLTSGAWTRLSAAPSPMSA